MSTAIQYTLQDEDIHKIAAAVKSMMFADLNDIKGNVSALESKLSTVLASIDDRLDELKNENVTLKSENEQLKKVNSQLQTSVDSLEQYSRRNSIRITGIAESAKLNTDEVVIDIAKRANIQLDMNDIDRSHRVGPPRSGVNRPILVKFTSYRPKHKIMKSRKDWYKHDSKDPILKSIYVNEDLTKCRAKLFSEARTFVKSKLCKKAWTWDGKVFVTDLNDTKHRIDTSADLNKFGSAAAVPTSRTTTVQSSVPAYSPTYAAVASNSHVMDCTSPVDKGAAAAAQGLA